MHFCLGFYSCYGYPPFFIILILVFNGFLIKVSLLVPNSQWEMSIDVNSTVINEMNNIVQVILYLSCIQLFIFTPLYRDNRYLVYINDIVTDPFMYLYCHYHTIKSYDLWVMNYLHIYVYIFNLSPEKILFWVSV